MGWGRTGERGERPARSAFLTELLPQEPGPVQQADTHAACCPARSSCFVSYSALWHLGHGPSLSSCDSRAWRL